MWKLLIVRLSVGTWLGVAMATAAHADETRRTVLNVNLLGFTKGEVGAWIDWFGPRQFQPTLGFLTTTRKESRESSGGAEVPTDRTFAEIGVAWHWQAKGGDLNLTVAPIMYFGQEVDAVDVERKSGLGGRLLARLKLSEDFELLLGSQLDGAYGGSGSRGRAVLGVSLNL